jgi:hypothetical protein
MLRRLRFRNTTLEELLAGGAPRLPDEVESAPSGGEGERQGGTARPVEMPSQGD